MARLRLLIVSTTLLLMSPGIWAADMQQLLRMSEQLDQLDRSDFESLIRKADACTTSRSFSCAETHLSQAGKYATTPALKSQLESAHARLKAERAAQAEEERVAAERRRQEREERLARQREEREERERERRELAAAASERNARAPVVIGQNSSADQERMQRWANLNNQYVQGAQAERVRRQQEAESQRQRIAAESEERRREYERSQARAREEERRRQLAEENRQRELRERAERERSERLAQAARTSERTLTVTESAPGSRVVKPPVYKDCPPGYTWYDPVTKQGAPGGTCFANPAASGNSGTLVAQGPGSQANGGRGSSGQGGGSASSGAGSDGSGSGGGRGPDRSGGGGGGGEGSSEGERKKRHGYIYKTAAIGVEWKDCESTRDGARVWAQRGLAPEATRVCGTLGPGWSRAVPDFIEFPGYEQALVCSGGKSWRYKITDVVVKCAKME